MGAAPPADLVTRLRAGDIGALARAISIVENEAPGCDAILSAVYGEAPSPKVVGFTGPPGAGKSSLISAAIKAWRARGRQVGVVAVDPSSPITGGAILGDRIRMMEHVADPGVFARSLASRGHLGGVSRMTRCIVDLMRLAPLDVVIVETVGTGQSEVEVASIADVKLVVSAPGLGDDIQAIKAGILEIADVMVVSKSDRPEAARTVRHLEAMLMLRATNRDVPVLATSIVSGEGIARLIDTVDDLLRKRQTASPAERAAQLRQVLAGLVADAVRSRLRRSGDPAVAAVCADFAAGRLSLAAATQQALGLLASEEGKVDP